MKDSVWSTYHARIEAAKRFASNDFHSQLLLVWYAVSSAILAIVTLRYPLLLGADTAVIGAISSVALLAMSMFVTSQDFRGRSIAMRANYLALQALYREMDANNVESTIESREKYTALLAAAENHTGYDYVRFRVMLRGSLKSPVTLAEMLQFYKYSAYRKIIFVILYSAPIALFVAGRI